MSEWTPFLNTRASDFLKLDDGTGYGGFSNYVASPHLATEPKAVEEAKGLLPRAQLLPENLRGRIPRAIFVQDGHVHILEFSRLKTRLGDDFQYAMNGTRSIPYTYGLSAPLGTPIPSLAELESRGGDIKSEIERLVRAINERQEVQGTPFSFEGKNYGSGLWDNTAEQIMAGKPPSKVVITEMSELKPGIQEMIPEAIFEGSKKNFPNLLPPPKIPLHVGPLPHTERPPLTPSASSKVSRGSSGGTLTQLVVACVAIFAGAWALSELVRRLSAGQDRKKSAER